MTSTKLNLVDFDKVYTLMQQNFPIDEFRTYKHQKSLLDNPNYQILVLYTKNNDIKAFIETWEFDKYIYVDHLVVNPDFQGQGIGTKLLLELKNSTNKTIVLEVEPPVTLIQKRRIEFYTKNNFFLNPYPYIQPPISPGKNTIPLMIMTSDKEMSENEFNEIVSLLYQEVYQVNNVQK